MASVSPVISSLNTSASTFNRHIAALQDPSKSCCLGDYTVFARGINFWETDMNSPTSQTVFNSLQAPAALLGWGVDESSTVSAASAVGGFVHASDWARNLATLSNIFVPTAPQRPSSAVPDLAGKHAVCFLMTDGDNIQWLVSSFTNNANWWASPDRGSVPLGWTLSPAIHDLAPVVLRYLYDTASNASGGRDFFVAAPSGLGYTYPDMMPDWSLPGFTNITSAYMSPLGLNILNILGQNYNEAAAAAFLQRDNIDAIFWYDYSSYSALDGNITFINNKPVIGGRFQLWSGTFYDPDELIAQLDIMPKNPDSPSGYSLIPVHVWSNNVTDVRYVSDTLQKIGGFAVLTPDEFVNAIQTNLGK